MDPKKAIGMTGGSGSPPFTKIGGAIQGAVQAKEHLGQEAIRRFKGWISDVRLPLGDKENVDTRGPVVKIFFDSSTMNDAWRDQWFRLAHDPAELLAQYGTEDSIRRNSVRVELSVYGVSVYKGIVKIIGDRRQDNTHRSYTKTPVRCWGDVMNCVARGGP